MRCFHLRWDGAGDLVQVEALDDHDLRGFHRRHRRCRRMRPARYLGARGFWLVRLVIVAAFSLIPVAHLAGLLWPPDELYGPAAVLGSWMWVALLIAGVGAAAARPVSPEALRFLAPYAVFLLLSLASLLWAFDMGEGIDVLGRLATPFALYLTAWHTSLDDRLMDGSGGCR